MGYRVTPVDTIVVHSKAVAVEVHKPPEEPLALEVLLVQLDNLD